MLSDQDKTKVRWYLGQSTLFRYRNPRLEGVFNSLDYDAETIIRNILAQLAAYDLRIFGDGTQVGYAGKTAGVKAVEEISFMGNTGDSVDRSLRKQARTLVGRLSSLVGVPIYADVYSSQGWPGDTYSAEGLGQGSNGNQIRLG